LSAEPTMKILDDALGKKVLVRLRGGNGIRGVLMGFDAHMNLVLHEAEEIQGETSKKLGDIVVRGDNIILVSPCR